MSKLKFIKNILHKSLKYSIFSSGVFFILMLAISFTTLPYWGIYSLAVSESDFDFEPDYVVVMGGGGMPSQTALIRLYYASEASKKFPLSKVILALPSNLSDSTSHLIRMEADLRARKVKAPILFENKGTNTRSQALLIKKMLNEDLDAKILIVSSPEHIYRTVKSFKKVGFKYVGGYPAFERDIDNSLDFNSSKIGGKEYLPEVGQNSQLRYQFWNHLRYEIILLREYTAIAYYKIQSWI